MLCACNFRRIPSPTSPAPYSCTAVAHPLADPRMTPARSFGDDIVVVRPRRRGAELPGPPALMRQPQLVSGLLSGRPARGACPRHADPMRRRRRAATSLSPGRGAIRSGGRPARRLGSPVARSEPHDRGFAKQAKLFGQDSPSGATLAANIPTLLTCTENCVKLSAHEILTFSPFALMNISEQFLQRKLIFVKSVCG